MKTILVGDLHLKAELILPIIEEQVRQYGCKRVIFLGDYVDDWSQQSQTDVYLRDLEYLATWKQKMVDNGIEVIMLLGNHDAPYLVEEVERYSLQAPKGFMTVRNLLFAMNLQITFQLDDFLVSHAGYCYGQETKPWHFDELHEADVERINELNHLIGVSRGGDSFSGSPIWADYEQELLDHPNPSHLKQIVGHTPQAHIKLHPNDEQQLYDVDTFSMWGSTIAPYYQLIGDGSTLLFDDATQQLHVIETDWQNMETLNKLLAIRGE